MGPKQTYIKPCNDKENDLSMRTPDEVRKLFDRWAETYDQDMQPSPGPLIGYVDGYGESRLAAAGALPLHGAMHVLDIGIGTGGFSEIIAPHVAYITGIDVSEQMLAHCRAKHPDYTLRAGSFTSIPFQEPHFDLIVSSFAFHEVLPGERPEACAQVFRVLRPGGLLCILDIMFASPEAMREMQVVAGHAWDDEEDYPLVGELDGLLRAAGLRALQWQHIAQGHWAMVGRKV